MNKSKLIILSVLVISLSTPVVTYAEPVMSTATVTGDRLDTLNKQQEDNQVKIAKLIDDIQSIDNDLSTLTLQINDTQNNLNKVTSDLISAKEQLNDAQSVYDGRVRSSYESGLVTADYLEILLKSKSLDSLMDNYTAITLLIKNDKNLVDSITSTKKEIEKKSSNLNDLKSSLDSDKTKLEERKATSAKSLADLNALQAQTQQDVETAENSLVDPLIALIQISNSPSDIAGIVNSLNTLKPRLHTSALSKIDPAIAQANQKIQSMSSSLSVPPPSTTSKIVLEAYKYLGIPYLWGGNDPSTGMDCSGFMEYVYKQMGYSISRTTYTQVNEGVEVPVTLQDLQPGDLIFFGDKSAPHHVGMYVGNGMYIQAPHTGDVIKVSSGALSACTARRILK